MNLIFVAGTTGSAHVNKSAMCENYQIERKKNADIWFFRSISIFLGVFLIVFGCNFQDWRIMPV